ncbi:hypothetical protein IGK47_003441 [Enterococcus sp. AZ007]
MNRENKRKTYKKGHYRNHAYTLMKSLEIGHQTVGCRYRRARAGSAKPLNPF